MIAQLPNHLWQSTIFAVAVALAALLLRRNRAGVRFAKDDSVGAPALPSDMTVPGSGSADVPPGASIFTVLEQQVGLKLAPIRGAEGFLVVDRVERPRTGG